MKRTYWRLLKRFAPNDPFACDVPGCLEAADVGLGGLSEISQRPCWHDTRCWKHCPIPAEEVIR